MGFYKNMEVALQEITDPELYRIVAWDIEHKGLLTAEERWRILTNEKLLNAALDKWEHGDNDESVGAPTPKPASAHIALHRSRRDLRVKRSRFPVIGWALIIAALTSGVTVLVVSL
jgi:hypothetical protein